MEPQPFSVNPHRSKQASQEIVKKLLTSHLHQLANCPDIKTIPIFDDERGHYQLLEIGWDSNSSRVLTPLIHCDVMNGQVWIQENRTDADLAQELIRLGLTYQEIVLGLHPESIRAFSDYASG